MLNDTLVSTLPQTRRGNDRAQQCLWYAWGRFDQARLDSPADMFDWARDMGRNADDYEQGRASFLPSIVDQFYFKWPEMKS
jgi:hypothetical protein